MHICTWQDVLVSPDESQRTSARPLLHDFKLVLSFSPSAFGTVSVDLLNAKLVTLERRGQSLSAKNFCI